LFAAEAGTNICGTFAAQTAATGNNSGDLTALDSGSAGALTANEYSFLYSLCGLLSDHGMFG
jgi:hypothetical protein